MKQDSILFERGMERLNELKQKYEKNVRNKSKTRMYVDGYKETIANQMSAIEMYTKKMEENQQAFVEECKPVFSKIFFLNNNYQKFMQSLPTKYPELKEYIECFDLLSKDLDKLSFEDCLAIINNEDLKRGVIVDKETNHSIIISPNIFLGCEAKNIDNKKAAEEKLQSLKFWYKIFRSNRLNRKIDRLETELKERECFSKILQELIDCVEDAKVACNEISGLLNSSNYLNAKRNKNLVITHERSLERFKASHRAKARIENDKLREKNETEALKKSFGKDVLTNGQTNIDEIFKLGLVAATLEDKKISQYIINEFNNEKKI